MRCSARSSSCAGEISAGLAQLARGQGVPGIFFAPLSGSLLGLYNPQQDIIVLHEKLLDCDAGTRFQIALHEYAHRINWMRNSSLLHDADFRDICASLGCEPDYARAQVSLVKKEGILDRVRKLQALTRSPFEAESQSAMRKVRQLMAAYSLTEREDDEDTIYMCDLVTARQRITLADTTLCTIVQKQTGIYLIRIKTDGHVCLRAYGSGGELEVACYLVDVLRMAIDKELARRRRRAPQLYRGIVGTNSFYAGVLSALEERIRGDEQAGDSSSKALVGISRGNEEKALRLVFSGTRIVRRSHSYIRNSQAYEGGKDFGSSLNLARGLKGDGGHKALPQQMAKT